VIGDGSSWSCAVRGCVRLTQPRRYDDTGVITPGRSEGGQRRYSRNDIAQLERALSLSGEGIGPPGIKRILELEARVDELESGGDD
jgi:MerR family transcriptional regulator/heat shock protein HspR